MTNKTRRIITVTIGVLLLVLLGFGITLAVSHPEITLEGADTVDVGTEEYVEPGYTAKDVFGKDITDKVETKMSHDAVTYTVTGKFGKKATATRKLVDTAPPEIMLTGGDTTVMKGGTYREPGVGAYDFYDGNLTEEIKATEVDTSKVGKQEITYTVTDKSGNTATATRTVTVKKKQGTKPAIYLTFDDGPGKYTEQILDILDEYGVKATFFVTNQFPKYQSLIKREAKSGHTVAIHTYSHNYEKIYASADAFWEDIEKMNEVIKKQTGKKTNILRFPGGASNTISRFTEGIMTQLVSDCALKGYQYVDWNVDSADAENAGAETIYNNVINGVSNHENSIILMHDVKEATVEALPDIIQWGIDNGYTFKVITAEGYVVHHQVNN